MIKKLVETYINKSKNKEFSFDKNINNSLLYCFVFEKLIALIRSIKFLHIKRRGKLLFFGKNVTLFYKKNIHFGNNVNIGNNVKISSLGKKRLEIKDNVTIGSFSQIITSTSFNYIGEYIIIEENVGMGEFAYIGGGGGTIIGANTIIGQYFSVHPENHIYSDKSTLIRQQGVTRKGVKVGKNCWIGSKVTILDGVAIGDNCVIAAGSVVTKSFSNNNLIAGVPAKVLKKL